MYHALVRIDGQWTSFGLHVPLQEWTKFFALLQCEHGKENVTYLPWKNVPLKNVYDVEARTREEVRLAREVQHLWNNGLTAAAEGAGLNLERGITQLRQAKQAAVV